MKSEKKGKTLGTKPEDFKKSLGNLNPQIIDHPSTEDNYRLRQNILRVGTGEKMKSLLFSSCTKGEGNSTTLINFSISISFGGEKVLLVDTNLRDPFLHKKFNLNNENGLTELFFNKSLLREVVKKTEYNNLFVITSGTPHMNPFMILESESLFNQIKEIKKVFDWVLFDSPPVNTFNDAAALAARMDGVIIVVQAEKTRWEVARTVKNKLENAGGNILGVILNRRRLYIPEWLYKTV